LRVARQLTLERLAVLDVEQGAALADITRAMTELAEASLELALARARADQDARFGVPRNARARRSTSGSSAWASSARASSTSPPTST
jgi:glutamate-ammonia-ligase adenylyltransferase